MKTVYLFALAVFFSLSLSAQSRTQAGQDMIQKLNGEEMKGKIVRITDDAVYFTYPGETLEYPVNKSDISKIVHSSGREEIFNSSPMPSASRREERVTMSASPADHHNKIAVLPFTYLIDNQPTSDEVGYKAQQDAYSFLTRHSAGYTIIDPRTTNALLVKAGINREKMIGYTMSELCDVLGVEYVVEGAITQTKGAATSYTGTNSNGNVKRDNRGKSYNDYSSSYSNSAQRYDINVSLQIYMDNNVSIYDKSHKMFLSNTDGSYSSPLEFLLKRCPLYRK